ncbi:hypothetical protein JCM24511_02788 [Saitozyma sp. JCM 24511]|nr:hypothetical protein JCM24511_02788 [Saitozyma sp. JCM 24511]
MSDNHHPTSSSSSLIPPKSSADTADLPSYSTNTDRRSGPQAQPTMSNEVPMQHHHGGVMHETDEELTEDERIEYEKGLITWEKAKDWRFWFRKEWWYYYLVFIFLIIIVALMAFFHTRIVDWLTPFVRKLQQLKYGWLIPPAIIFVLSFPPLFGNEIVMVLVGIVWGLGKGFAIVAVGTILGEIANYVVFKYWCRARADRMAKKSLNYACLSQAIVEGGFFMAWCVRLSAVPTHITTVIFAVCGLKFYHFFIALILGLPKQLVGVYVGVVLAQPSGNSHLVSDLVWAAYAVITVFSLWYIYHGMTRVRRKVLLGMREDLRRKHIRVTDPSVDPDLVEQGARGGPDGMGFGNSSTDRMVDDDQYKR